VGTIANLRQEKGLHQLIEAAALVKRRIPGVSFAIWGEGPLRPALEAQIRAYALANTVFLHGATREPQTVLRGCNIFVLPSLSEACSNVLMEALATGLPVIATRVGGNPGLVEEDRSGLLVPPADPSALAEAILRLLQTPALAARFAAAGRARAVAEFGMDRMLRRMEDLYRHMLILGAGASVDAGASRQ
jgi:glycosyltransferase involved in cell wall biosynthesis